MTIKCIIIDDEPIASKGMQEYVGQVDFLELAGFYEDPLQAYSILDTQNIDLILLDIEMPRLSGIDFIRSLKIPPLIIFTTAYSNYALEGYELDVVDFLVKPVSLARFIKAVNKVKELMPVRSHAKDWKPQMKMIIFLSKRTAGLSRYTMMTFSMRRPCRTTLHFI